MWVGRCSVGRLQIYLQYIYDSNGHTVANLSPPHYGVDDIKSQFEERK